MVVADGLVPIWAQGIQNYYHDLHQGPLCQHWSAEIRTRINNYIHILLWDVIIHPFPNFNGRWVKPPLALRYWLITFDCFRWMSSLNHILILRLVKLISVCKRSPRYQLTLWLYEYSFYTFIHTSLWIMSCFFFLSFLFCFFVVVCGFGFLVLFLFCFCCWTIWAEIRTWMNNHIRSCLEMLFFFNWPYSPIRNYSKPHLRFPVSEPRDSLP